LLNTIGRFELFPSAGTMIVFRFVMSDSVECSLYNYTLYKTPVFWLVNSSCIFGVFSYLGLISFIFTAIEVFAWGPKNYRKSLRQTTCTRLKLFGKREKKRAKKEFNIWSSCMDIRIHLIVGSFVRITGNDVIVPEVGFAHVLPEVTLVMWLDVRC
jgi:hypothetical protein